MIHAVWNMLKGDIVELSPGKIVDGICDLQKIVVLLITCLRSLSHDQNAQKLFRNTTNYNNLSYITY